MQKEKFRISYHVDPQAGSQKLKLQKSGVREHWKWTILSHINDNNSWNTWWIKLKLGLLPHNIVLHNCFKFQLHRFWINEFSEYRGSKTQKLAESVNIENWCFLCLLMAITPEILNGSSWNLVCSYIILFYTIVPSFSSIDYELTNLRNTKDPKTLKSRGPVNFENWPFCCILMGITSEILDGSSWNLVGC